MSRHFDNSRELSNKEFDEFNEQLNKDNMGTIKKASDYLYDIGLGLDPKSDELIIEAIESYHKDKIAKLITDLKIKNIAFTTYMRDNLLDDTKRDEIKYISSKKEIVSEIIEMINVL